MSVQFTPDGQVTHGVKFWPMTHRMTVSKAFNIAAGDLFYGPQTSSSTRDEFTRPNQFDFIAGDYDDVRLDYLMEFKAKLWKLVVGDRYIESLLELGPTTGYAADMALIKPSNPRYTVVDGSQGLLNQVVFKHDVADVRPLDPSDFLNPWADLIGERWDATVALFGAADFLKPEVLAWALERTNKVLVLMHTRVDSQTMDLGLRRPDDYRASAKAARALPGSYTFEMGDWDVTVVSK